MTVRKSEKGGKGEGTERKEWERKEKYLLFCSFQILFLGDIVLFSRKIKENDITKKQNLELIILGYE